MIEVITYYLMELKQWVDHWVPLLFFYAILIIAGAVCLFFLVAIITDLFSKRDRHISFAGYEPEDLGDPDWETMCPGSRCRD